MKWRLFLICTLSGLLVNFSAGAQVDNTDIQKDSIQTAIFFNAIKEYNSGNLESAKGYFQQLASLNPQDDAAYYYLANIAIRTDDVSSGELYLKKGIELDSANFWYKEMLAQIYLRTKRVAEAVSVYEQLLEEFPKKSSIYYNLTNLYINSNDMESAKKMLEKIEATQGKSEAVAMTYFNIYRMEQNWEGALNYLINFDKEYQSPRIETIIGDMYADRYRDTLAIQYYNKALALDKQYAPAMYGRAEVYRLKGDYENYFKDIKPFFANKGIDPVMKSEYLKQVFQVPNFIPRFRSHIDTIMQSIEIAHPTDTTSNAFVASYYGQGGDKEKCKELFKKNYTLYPDKYSTMFQYIIALYQLEDWDALEVECDSALMKFPGDIDLVQLRGIARYQKEEWDKAIVSYKELADLAVKKNDTTALLTSYTILGDMLYQQNDSKNAFSYYKKALKINPNDNAVLNNFAYFLSLEGKSLKQAYEMSKKTIETEPDNPTYLDTFGWILYLMDKPLEAKAQFKHAMLYGGNKDANILDHYAEVLFKLKEYDLAFIYWDQAKALDPSLGIDKKIVERKQQMNK